ncbi:protein ROOT PRIMORDIUM DEFECTIVE 1 [Typha angustifolia]|uniref:protein ROOT PRIMORDIUM DEFECTIVE 1 n=1 Tax=Typha angustifolia TaxID=59011 RepID=UPI003C300D0E
MPPPSRPHLLPSLLHLSRRKTTSAQHVAARHLDPTFEKLMEGYKHLLKSLPVIDLILASPPPHSLPLPFLSSPKLSQRLRLNRGALHFLRSLPHLFSLHPSPIPLIHLTHAASAALAAESSAASSSSSAAVSVLRRLLTMSPSNALPLRAVFRVWRELGLPDDFEDSVLAANPSLFSLQDNPREPNTHLLRLVSPNPSFTPAIEEWRGNQGVDLRFGFKLGFPPGMRLGKDYKSKVRTWQMLPYSGPYDKRVAKGGRRGAEKRAVGIAHEFLSLTVEKMVEVEKFSQFRKWFGIELNVRDLFLDHPGIFYLSTKGRRHTVFLREAYEKGRLIAPNPIYEARRRLLDLVLLRRRGLDSSDFIPKDEEEEEDVA